MNQVNPTKDTQESEATVVMGYAEAYRNMKMAEAELAKYRERFEAILTDSETGGMTYVYTDGRAVRFTLQFCLKTKPVSFAEAKEILQFGDAKMARIASIDAKALRAMSQAGYVDGALADMCLPQEPYHQIRGKFYD